MAIKKQAFPKTLGGAIDALYNTRDLRLGLQRQADEVKAQEAALTDYIQQKFEKADIEGAKGEFATASLKTSVQAEMDDWETFLEFAVKVKNRDLLQRRVNITAARARWDEKVAIPGVKAVPVTTLSVSKR